ncbi:Chromatin structure-remodeling complex protein BSH [Linum perenne]
MKPLPLTTSKTPVKFRMPTSENLVPIRLDIEVDGQRFKDAFTWNPSDPDSEVVVFAKRTVKDLKLPPSFVTQIVHSIQSQLTDFRSYQGQDMFTGEKIVPIKLDLRVNHTLIKDQFLWVRLVHPALDKIDEKNTMLIVSALYNAQDLNNFDSDPEEFSKTFCTDLGIEDPEVGPAVAFAIREQLYEVAIQSVATARESRISKKGRRSGEYSSSSRTSGAALDLMKLFSNRYSVIRKRKEWELYGPMVDILSNEEVTALEVREERKTR